MIPFSLPLKFTNFHYLEVEQRDKNYYVFLN